MENLPEIIDACNRLIVTWGDEVIRQKMFEYIEGFSIVVFMIIVLPIIGLSIWRLGINRKWWN